MESVWNLLSKHLRDRWSQAKLTIQGDLPNVLVSRKLSEVTFSEWSSSSSYFSQLFGGVWLWQYFEIERRQSRLTRLVASGDVAVI